MAGVKLIAAVSALVLTGTLASAAHADPMITDPSKALADRNQWSTPAQKKSFEWDAAKSRWGLKFDVEQQPPALGQDWKNVQAGAYFKVTPQLRLGAGVSLSDEQSSSTPTMQTPPPPKVRVEGAFKF